MAIISKKLRKTENVGAKQSPGRRRKKSKKTKLLQFVDSKKNRFIFLVLFLTILSLVGIRAFPIITKNIASISSFSSNRASLKIPRIGADQRTVIFYGDNGSVQEITPALLKSNEKITGIWPGYENHSFILAFRAGLGNENTSLRLVLWSPETNDSENLLGVIGTKIGDLSLSGENKNLSYRVARKTACGEEYDTRVINMSSKKHLHINNNFFDYTGQVEGRPLIITRTSESAWIDSSRLYFTNRPVVCLKNGQEEPMQEKRYIWDTRNNVINEVYEIKSISL